MYYSMDSWLNREATKTYTIFVDDIKPESNIQPIGTYTFYKDELYLKPDNLIELTAEDIGIGIEKTMLKIDDGFWEEYTGSFTLSLGSHTIKLLQYR
jgi:hypothetical protein